MELEQNSGIDLNTLNAVADATVAFELEMKDPAGLSYKKPIFFLVIGRHADVVNKHFARSVNEFVQRREHARRRGKEMEPKSVEQVQQENIEGAAVRVTGWKGINQPFDAELLKSALRRNPHWIDQITEASDDAGNFTKKA